MHCVKLISCDGGRGWAKMAATQSKMAVIPEGPEDTETGYVEISGYMTQVWNDPRLKFDYRPPFRNIDQVRMSTRDIWIPDIDLLEAAPPGVKLMSRTDQAIVKYNGTVRYFPFVTLPKICDVIPDKANDTASFLCQFR
ncbi:hypothetical protein ACOMHN_033384 [Nucella lapillus]